MVAAPFSSGRASASQLTTAPPRYLLPLLPTRRHYPVLHLRRDRWRSSPRHLSNGRNPRRRAPKRAAPSRVTYFVASVASRMSLGAGFAGSAEASWPSRWPPSACLGGSGSSDDTPQTQQAPKAGETARGEPSTSTSGAGPAAKAGGGGSSAKATAPRPPASPSPARPQSPHYAAARPVAPVRMPAPPSARTHRLRGKLVIAILLVVVVFAVVPSLRHTVSKWYTKAEGVFVPTYAKVPLASVKVANPGDCGAAQLQGNDTVYWYTRPGGGSSELLTMTIASSFTGTISKIAFTPLKPATHAPQAGQASPYPQQVVLSSTPAGAGTVINLNNPPSFQHENIKVVHPSEVSLRLVTTDQGAAAGTCAETGVVLYEKTN